MSNPVSITPAQPSDAPTLTAIALASKAHWGYDAAFMAACRDALTVTARDVAQQPTYVVRQNGAIVGFYMLAPHDARVVELDFLFVAPDAIGHGFGRELFVHATRIAREQCYELMTIQADPNAATFYERMGAHRVGATPSGSIAGRALPQFQIALE